MATTGEAQSLIEKINPRSFGDRAYKGSPADVDDKLKKRMKKHQLFGFKPASKRRRVQGELSALTAEDEGVYEPKTEEMKRAYEDALYIIGWNHLRGGVVIGVSMCGLGYTLI